MKINAQIVADSINQQGDRITTMLVTFPRFILAELNTHRVMSKNSASSRAIPFKKMVESVTNNPFIPIAWQKEHSGMQGTEYLNGDFMIKEAIATWLIARDKAIHEAKNLNRIGATKQLCNRLLEPFMWHTVLITSTEWENFFNLRCPIYQFKIGHRGEIIKQYKSKKDFLNSKIAQTDLGKKWISENLITELDWFKYNKGQAEIHMMALAEAMWDAYNESTPKELQPGEWHIPFRNKIDEGNVVMITKDGHLMSIQEAYIKLSTAMCARTSYTVVGDEKEFGYDKQIELHDRMVNQVPFHASPFEHNARAMSEEEYTSHVKGVGTWYNEYDVPFTSTSGGFPTYFKSNDGKDEWEYGWSRNFKGFIQYRELLENK